MKKLVLPIVFLIIFTISPALGQDNTSNQMITLETDKLTYYEDDIITITGNVQKVVADQPIIIQVFFEETNKLMEIDQVLVTREGKFVTMMKAGGKLWKNEGVVIIRASYGTEFEAEKVIDFFSTSGEKIYKNYEVAIPGAGTFDAQYDLKGSTVTSFELNSLDLSLFINISSNADGVLELVIPRNAIDSLNEGGFDENFIIIIHRSGEEPIPTEFTELETSNEFRKLSIPIKNGDERIQIIGTHVVPEFGAIAAIILAVAITSIIVVSARTRTSLSFRIWSFFVNQV